MILIKKLGTKKNKSGNIISYGEFLCGIPKCGRIVERPLSDGYKCKSCGCIKKEVAIKNSKNSVKHGYYKTRLYKIWCGMKERCLKFKHISYKNYGGRGITICPEWTDKLNGFINFRDWALNNGYLDNLTIDRRDVNGNYEPYNCQWLTKSENSKRRKINLV